MVSRTAPLGRPDPFAAIERPVPPRSIQRPRLFARLDGARTAARGAWIEGPMGSGKTTLAAGWIAARRLRGAWVHVEDCACDPASVLQRLGAIGVDPESPRPVVPPLAPADALDVVRYARALAIRAFRRLGSGSVIVLDGWHAMPDQEVARQMAHGIAEGVPEGSAVLFLARRGQGDAPPRLPVIGAHDLRFDAREAESLARACGFTAGGLAGEWIAASGGWAAGTALLARARRFGVAVDPQTARFDPEALFRWCASDLLGRLPEATRRVLGCLARLPRFTPGMAGTACGAEGLEAVVEGIAREPLFVERDDVVGTLRFAPVFRSFLTSGTDGRAPAGGCPVTGVLEAAGWLDEAMVAALDNADWKAAARIAAMHAPGLVAEGRTDLAAAWLRALPDGARHEDPWLSHWLGRALAPREPAAGLVALDRAHARFIALDDSHGAVASALAALDLLTTRIVDPERQALWLVRFDAHGPDVPARLAAADEARLIAGGLALLRAAPDHAALEGWSARALQCLEHAPDRATRSRLAEFAARCCLQRATPDGLDAALVRWRQVIGDDDLMPARSAFAAARVEQAWRAGDLAMATDALANGLAFMEHSGIRHDAPRLHAIGALGWLIAGEPARAAALLDPYAGVGTACPPDDAALLATAQVGADLLEGRVGAARGVAKEMQATSADAGLADVLARLAKVQVHLADGEFEAAARAVEEALARATRCCVPHLAFALRIQRCHVALATGDRKALLCHLDDAMAMGVAHGCMVAHPGWAPAAMSRLLGEALGLGIAPDYTRRLIAAHALRPVHPADDRWPWPLRVRMFGIFELQLDGEAVHYGRKTPKRALELLKLVAAHGPAPIAVDTVIAALWPTASREGARRSFDVTVHRLRTLLGRAAMVQVEGGRVGLDPRTCWVDCWHLDAPSAPGSPAATRASHLIALYRGRLLPEDEIHAWLVPLRERAHADFVRQVTTLGDALEATRYQSHVDSLYRHALAVDPTCEPVHLRMLEALIRAGRQGDAVAHYHRLVQLLARTYGIRPSAAIETLMRPWL